MKKLFIGLITFASSLAHADNDTPGWLRSHDVSPDGSQVVFVYRGHLFSVPTTGGDAVQLTQGDCYDGFPRFSPDGRTIAFGSTREGGMCVFTMPAKGGTPTRVTWRSESESPVAWLDNKTVIYGSYSMPTADDVQFPTAFSQLNTVAVDRQRAMPHRWTDIPMRGISINDEGQVLYDDMRGYEDTWRKHHTSPMACDVWMRDKDGTCKRLTTFEGEDRNPVWNTKGDGFYYLSEQSGTFNLHHRTIDGKDKQLTDFKDAPVRYLRMSKSGLITFSHDGMLYTMCPGEKARKLEIHISMDQYRRCPNIGYYTSGAHGLSVSDKDVAFLFGGDVYVTSQEYKTTKRITNTAALERNVSLSSDGLSIVYDSERDGVWGIYKTTIVNKEEKTFPYATELKEECLTAKAYQAQCPKFSPDGKLVAFLKNRTELAVMRADGSHQVTVLNSNVNYSYSDGDLSFEWSPDSRWLLMNYQDNLGWQHSDVCVVAADGSKTVNLTNSGYKEYAVRWVLDGKAVLFNSDRVGMRSHGSWGAQQDLFITFLDKQAYDRFKMNKEEREVIFKEEKIEDKKDTTATKKDKKESKNKAEEKKDSVFHPDFDTRHIELRTVRLTRHSASMGDAVMNTEGTRLYYVSPDNLGTALWELNLEDGSLTRKTGDISYGGLVLSKDGKTMFFAQGGRIKKMGLGDSSSKTIDFEAEYEDHTAERFPLQLEHIYRTTKEKLYDPKMNGCDWDAVYKQHKKHLPHIVNGRDFADLASEMLGELNVSHTGCRYQGVAYTPETGQLGIFTTDGLTIDEVLVGGPLDGLDGVGKGSRLEAIDGVKLSVDEDYAPLLAGKVGRRVRLTIDGKTYIVKPISHGTQNDLLYDRWVDGRRKFVDSISGGTVAYVHIKAMNTPSFNKLYRELLAESNRTRKAVVVDVRHNGGGWLHNDVINILSGVNTATYKPRGHAIAVEPYAQWYKPSCMLVCENCYSNAHGTPWLYKERAVGKLIGAPVAGTMTAVWWEQIDGNIVYGIPQVPLVDRRGHELENQTLQPDIVMWSDAAALTSGDDPQLERATREMMK